MERRKLTRQDIDKVRNIEGFPNGTDEDIIALSDAPYYTVCPNPYISEFILENGTMYDEATDDYHREPFASDVSEGKTDPIYNAHSYHTKVPYRAIMKYILHYTKPGDIVYDGFCGSGMTGVAAQMCANKETVFSLQNDFTNALANVGSRKAILGDLSPAATFIASIFCKKNEAYRFAQDANDLLAKVQDEFEWMYKTMPDEKTSPSLFGAESGLINYIVWSDIFICPQCSREIVYWDAALDQKTKRVSEKFVCPHCAAELKKTECDRARTVVYDSLIQQNISIAKQKPVLINYTYCGDRYEKKPDKYDIELIDQIDNADLPTTIPKFVMPNGINTDQPKKSHGMYYAHQFYTRRTLWILSRLWDLSGEYATSKELRLILTGIMQISTKMSSFRYDSRNTNNTAGGILKGTLYIPSIQREGNVFQNYKRRLSSILGMMEVQSNFDDNQNVLIQVSSATNSSILDSSVDYIFTDPPL